MSVDNGSCDGEVADGICKTHQLKVKKANSCNGL